MDFLVDENLPVEVSELLAAAGHDATTVLNRQLRGAPDARVGLTGRAERRAIITLDLDFANVLLFPPGEYFGLVVLRLERQDKVHVLDVVARLIPKFEGEVLIGKLWVVDEERVRVR